MCFAPLLPAVFADLTPPHIRRLLRRDNAEAGFLASLAPTTPPSA
jgi:hypothetical protein